MRIVMPLLPENEVGTEEPRGQHLAEDNCAGCFSQTLQEPRPGQGEGKELLRGASPFLGSRPGTTHVVQGMNLSCGLVSRGTGRTEA